MPPEDRAPLPEPWDVGWEASPASGSTSGSMGTRGTEPDTSAGDNTSSEHCTDMGNARRLVKAHGADLLHCPELGKPRWLAWDGRRWVQAHERQAEWWAKEIPDLVDREARQVREAAQRQPAGSERREQLEARAAALTKHARRSESQRAQRDMLASTESEPGIAIRASAFDTDPLLVNVDNGTLDLHTGRLRLHDRNDRISKLAPVAYHSDATAPTWHGFLERILPSDPELLAFMQRAAGYVLAGENPEQVLLIFYGRGANGKSTLVEALRRVMGDYAATAPPQAFTDSRDGSVSRMAALASLAGARLVTLAETREGQGLDEAMVKSVTGGEPVNCCFKYGPWFEYQPLFTPWLSTNHRPRIRGTDDGIWRRLLLVPFTVSIPKQEQDHELGAKLWRERAGILAWMVEGYRQWCEQGLNPPASVRLATNDYRGEEDTVGQFVAECCERDPDARTDNGVIFAAYREWCEGIGLRPYGAQKFKPRLEAMGFGQKRGAQRYWPGLRLILRVTRDRRHA